MANETHGTGHSPSNASKHRGSGGTDKTRFVGKHSKDQILSLYVQRRNIFEYEREGYVEPLGGILRLQPATAERLEERGQVVMLGIVARLICDYGIQFGEHILYQCERQIYPLPPADAVPTGNGQHIFDFETKFVTSLPDSFHLPFIVRLPAGMPPSMTLLSPTAGNSDAWGLTYYVCAFITTTGSASISRSSSALAMASASAGRLGMMPPPASSSTSSHRPTSATIQGWSGQQQSRTSKRSSKVLLSFTRSFIADPSRKMTISPARGSNFRSFLTSSKMVALCAELDSSSYSYGDVININVKLSNPNHAKISGIRVTVKQVLGIRYGADPKHVIKSCLGRYEFNGDEPDGIVEDSLPLSVQPSSIIRRMQQHREGADGVYPLKEKATYENILRIRPLLDPNRFIYQLALESRLPRSSGVQPVLASSFNFDPMACINAGGGLERLKIISLEYYLNVHVVLPWATNLIVKLPFFLANSTDGGLSPTNPTMSFPATQDRPFSGPLFKEQSEGTRRTNPALSSSAKTNVNYEDMFLLRLAAPKSGSANSAATASNNDNSAFQCITGDLINFASDEDDDDDDFDEHSIVRPSKEQLARAEKDGIIGTVTNGVYRMSMQQGGGSSSSTNCLSNSTSDIDSSILSGGAASLLEDVRSAKEHIGVWRSSLVMAQRVVLDASSASDDADHLAGLARFDAKRRSMQRELVSSLDVITTAALPRFSEAIADYHGRRRASVSSIMMAKATESNKSLDSQISRKSFTSKSSLLSQGGGFTAAFDLAKAIIVRLGTIHTQVVQFNCPRAVQEAHMEDFNLVVDDVELLMSRTLRALEGRADEAGSMVGMDDLTSLLSQLRSKCTGLFRVIPAYPRFMALLSAAEEAFINFGWIISPASIDATARSATIATLSEGGMSVKLPLDDRAGVKFEAMLGHFEGDASLLASSFQDISTLLLDWNESFDGGNEAIDTQLLVEKVEVFITAMIQFFHTGALLDSMIQRQASHAQWIDTAGIAGCWQWRFLLAVLDWLFLPAPPSGSSSSVSTWQCAYIYGSRQYIEWSAAVRRKDDTADNAGCIVSLGNRVISSMRPIVDDLLLSAQGQS